MSATSVMSDLAGVRACVVVDATGRILERAGNPVDGPRVVGAVLAVGASLNAAGTRLGIGDVRCVVSKGAEGSWISSCEAGTRIAVQVALGQATGEVEAMVLHGTWSAAAEWDIGDAELEVVSAAELAEEPLVDAAAPAPVPTSRPLDQRPTRPVPSDAGILESSLCWRRTTRPPRGALAAAFGEDAETTQTSGRVLVSDAPPAFAGRLQTVGLPALLEFLRFAQRTGTMACTSPTGTGRIYLRGGRLLGASSPTTHPLPRYLVASGVVTQDALKAPGIAAEAWSQPAPSVAALLVKKGVVPLAHVRHALEDQIRDALAELLTWSDGEFCFDPEATVEGTVGGVGDDSQLEFDSQAILLQILKQRDEASLAAT